MEIYRVTKIFPKNERFGFTSQMKRATLSIPSNISEGCEKNYPRILDPFLPTNWE
ncbi:MAG: four helix bundle protein, partial [Deltaproteobacteria bacterium]|nr:four helix bundle protein [Deltaproteobacteria bacterium]